MNGRSFEVFVTWHTVLKINATIILSIFKLTKLIFQFLIFKFKILGQVSNSAWRIRHAPARQHVKRELITEFKPKMNKTQGMICEFYFLLRTGIILRWRMLNLSSLRTNQLSQGSLEFYFELKHTVELQLKFFDFLSSG